MLVGRTSNLGFRRVERLPDDLDSMAFSDVDGNVGAHDDYNTLER